MKEEELISEAQQVLGETENILAAGIFGLQDDYGKIAVAGVATGTVAGMAGMHSPL